MLPKPDNDFSHFVALITFVTINKSTNFTHFKLVLSYDFPTILKDIDP